MGCGHRTSATGSLVPHACYAIDSQSHESGTRSRGQGRTRAAVPEAVHGLQDPCWAVQAVHRGGSNGQRTRNEDGREALLTLRLSSVQQDGRPLLTLRLPALQQDGWALLSLRVPRVREDGRGTLRTLLLPGVWQRRLRLCACRDRLGALHSSAFIRFCMPDPACDFSLKCNACATGIEPGCECWLRVPRTGCRTSRVSSTSARSLGAASSGAVQNRQTCANQLCGSGHSPGYASRSAWPGEIVSPSPTAPVHSPPMRRDLSSAPRSRLSASRSAPASSAWPRSRSRSPVPPRAASLAR